MGEAGRRNGEGSDGGRLIRPHGGFRGLKSYQMAEIVFDATAAFCGRLIDRRSRTHDQMVQAARSGKQNIAEASQASGTSKKTELKLVGVARASRADGCFPFRWARVRLRGTEKRVICSVSAGFIRAGESGPHSTRRYNPATPFGGSCRGVAIVRDLSRVRRGLVAGDRGEYGDLSDSPDQLPARSAVVFPREAVSGGGRVHRAALSAAERGAGGKPEQAEIGPIGPIGPIGRVNTGMWSRCPADEAFPSSRCGCTGRKGKEFCLIGYDGLRGARVRVWRRGDWACAFHRPVRRRWRRSGG